MSPTTTLRQKIFLFLFGTFLAFILLETGLRIAGAVILFVQERRNMLSIQKGGECRVLCIGESTTMNAYPRALEEILNKRDLGVRFSVIDKGLIATDTSAIASSLDSYLDTYHPQMVVAMIGVNDFGAREPLETRLHSRVADLVTSLKTYKLIRLIMLHSAAKAATYSVRGDLMRKTCGRTGNGTEEADADLRALLGARNGAYRRPAKENTDGLAPNSEEDLLGLAKLAYKEKKWRAAEKYFKRAYAVNPQNGSTLVGLGVAYFRERRYGNSEACFRQALEIEPNNSLALIRLGGVYLSTGNAERAREFYAKATEVSPSDPLAYYWLARSYRKMYDLVQAEECYLKALALDPRLKSALIALGEIYRLRGRTADEAECLLRLPEIDPASAESFYFAGLAYHHTRQYDQAVASYQRVVELDPAYRMAYFRLAECYVRRGQWERVQDILCKVLVLHPRFESARTMLAWSYRRQGEIKKAQEVLEEGIRAGLPENGKLYAQLARVYEEQGMPEEAKTYYEKYKKEARDLGDGFYSAETMHNYRVIRGKLGKRSIALIAVQYPMSDVAYLKEIVGESGDISFVDNENSFREAVKKEGYNTYFTDVFAGNFGHCTKKGNELLALNIADVIEQRFAGAAKRSGRLLPKNLVP